MFKSFYSPIAVDLIRWAKKEVDMDKQKKLLRIAGKNEALYRMFHNVKKQKPFAIDL